MTMSAVQINTQESPEITPLKPVEQLQSIEQQKKAEQEIQKAPGGSTESDEITTEDVKDVLEAFQELSQTIQTRLSFTVHDENNEIVVKVFDKESNELIRQFPSDEVLALQDKMSDLAGFLFDQNV